jgi:ribosomal subunit interface protein
VDITIKGRHTEVSERFRQHVVGKLTKLERYEHKVTKLDVEVCEEHNPRQADMRERVELTCHAKGPVIRAEAAAPDAYAALDLACSRLEARLRRAADRRRVHHGARTPKSVRTVAAPVPAAGAGSEEPDLGDTSDRDGDGGNPASNGHRRLDTAGLRDLAVDGEPRVVREKVHQAAAMTLDQALFEMELVGHDFYLFVDAESGLPSVVYRRTGFDYGVIRLAH